MLGLMIQRIVVYHPPSEPTLCVIPITLNTVLTRYFVGNKSNVNTSPYLNPLIPSIVNSAENGNIGAVNWADFLISSVGNCKYVANCLYRVLDFSAKLGVSPYDFLDFSNSVIEFLCLVVYCSAILLIESASFAL